MDYAITIFDLKLRTHRREGMLINRKFINYLPYPSTVIFDSVFQLLISFIIDIIFI